MGVDKFYLIHVAKIERNCNFKTFELTKDNYRSPETVEPKHGVFMNPKIQFQVCKSAYTRGRLTNMCNFRRSCTKPEANGRR